MVLVNNNAAVLIEEKNLTGESLCKAVQELVSQPQKLRELGQNAQKLSMIDANERIYEELMRVYRNKKKEKSAKHPLIFDKKNKPEPKGTNLASCA